MVAGIELGGYRTVLGVPLLKQSALIGVANIYRQEVRPFTDKQIELVQNFAAQAVIAIENTRLLNELKQSLDQQTATADVLKVISRSTFDLQAVLDTLVELAARLCEADIVVIGRPKGKACYFEATYGLTPEFAEFAASHPTQIDRGTVSGRVLLDRQIVYVPDVQADPEYTYGRGEKTRSYRTVLGVPLLREGMPIGVIAVARASVRPFTDKQIELVTTFADQAVIAIENVRLFEAEQQRTRELSESLEQQTATADVLRVISSSPGELEPVFQAMLANAVRICEAKFGMLYLVDGHAYRTVAMHNAPPAFAEFIRRRGPFQPTPGGYLDHVMRTKQVSHTADVTAEAVVSLSPAATLGGARSTVTVPMLKDDELIGALIIYRQEVRPFTDKQIEVVQNFAAQAVIAIENTRLLNELRESLQQQTATADVLKVISSSPGELEPVFDAMLANATRICEAKFGILCSYDGNLFKYAAVRNVPPAFLEFVLQRGSFAPRAGTPLDRLLKTRNIVHRADASVDEVPTDSARLAGAKSHLAVPMFKDEALVGAIVIYRQEVRPFTEKQIELMKNFAAQAVIAIENTRLLNELRQSLQQQTATSEVLGVISSSPGELQPVFDAMLANATRICEASFGNLLLYNGDVFRHVALHNAPQAWAVEQERDPVAPRSSARMLYRVTDTKQVVHVADIVAENPEEPIAKIAGARTLMIAPMLKENDLVGVIAIYRQEVRPFTDKQIELVKNFAAQAVIAIENARLLNELRQSLEQQTATANVLGIISSSPGELEPVFQAILENATRICEAKFGQIFSYDDGLIQKVAHVNDRQPWLGGTTEWDATRPCLMARWNASFVATMWFISPISRVS